MRRKRRKSVLEGVQAEEVAKKRAWAVLQVLSGQMGVTEAAQAGQISVPRYYQLEQKAVVAMVQALSPGAPGGRGTAQEQLGRAKKRLEALETEQARQRQLMRLARKLWGPLADPTVGRPVRRAELETAPAPEAPGKE